jgi:hypothetical protein
MQTLKRYYHDFKFKHPTPNDIKRTAERVSGANLDWYLVDWTQTTNTIDYAIKNVESATDGVQRTGVTLERIGRMPMPIDVAVEYTDGTKETFYIPLRMMSFEKPNPNPAVKASRRLGLGVSDLLFEISKPKAPSKKSRSMKAV